jgi:hypothetical protein
MAADDLAMTLAKFRGDPDPWANPPAQHRWSSFDVQCLRLATIQEISRQVRAWRRVHYSSKVRWR